MLGQLSPIHGLGLGHLVDAALLFGQLTRAGILCAVQVTGSGDRVIVLATILRLIGLTSGASRLRCSPVGRALVLAVGDRVRLGLLAGCVDGKTLLRLGALPLVARVFTATCRWRPIRDAASTANLLATCTSATARA